MDLSQLREQAQGAGFRATKVRGSEPECTRGDFVLLVTVTVEVVVTVVVEVVVEAVVEAVVEVVAEVDADLVPQIFPDEPTNI